MPCRWSHSSLFDALFFSETRYAQFTSSCMCSKYCCLGRVVLVFSRLLFLPRCWLWIHCVGLIYFPWFNHLHQLSFFSYFLKHLLISFPVYPSIVFLIFLQIRNSMLPVCVCLSCRLSIFHYRMSEHSGQMSYRIFCVRQCSGVNLWEVDSRFGMLALPMLSFFWCLVLIYHWELRCVQGSRIHENWCVYHNLCNFRK